MRGREPTRPPAGEEATREVVVSADMLAVLFDRVVHPVYGTASMVRHMEEAGRVLVERYLGEDEDATGYRIEVTHERPARPGERLQVRAVCTFADADQCVAEVEVRGPRGLVGRGKFVQRYVRKGAL